MFCDITLQMRNEITLLTSKTGIITSVLHFLVHGLNESPLAKCLANSRCLIHGSYCYFVSLAEVIHNYKNNSKWQWCGKFSARGGCSVLWGRKCKVKTHLTLLRGMEECSSINLQRRGWQLSWASKAVMKRSLSERAEEFIQLGRGFSDLALDILDLIILCFAVGPCPVRCTGWWAASLSPTHWMAEPPTLPSWQSHCPRGSHPHVTVLSWTTGDLNTEGCFPAIPRSLLVRQLPLSRNWDLILVSPLR